MSELVAQLEAALRELERERDREQDLCALDPGASSLGARSRLPLMGSGVHNQPAQHSGEFYACELSTIRVCLLFMLPRLTPLVSCGLWLSLSYLHLIKLAWVLSPFNCDILIYHYPTANYYKV